MSLFLLLPVIACLSCSNKTTDETTARFSLTDTMMQKIKTDTVSLRPIYSELRFSGKITPEENKMTTVFPVVSGYITKLNVALGDYVKKGQVLATFRSTDIADFEKQRRDAETELVVAK